MSRVLGALQTKSSLRSVGEGTDSARETLWVVHYRGGLKIGQGGICVGVGVVTYLCWSVIVNIPFPSRFEGCVGSLFNDI